MPETIINQNLITEANNQSFFGWTGNLLEREAQETVDSFKSKFDGLKNRLGGFNEAQEKIIVEREAGFRSLVAEQYNGAAAFRANNPSWMVAGPAKYNFARHEKRMDSAERKFRDYDEKAERYIQNTIEMVKNAMTDEEKINYWRTGKNEYSETITSNDPLAVEKMEAHIEYLEKVQARELAANKFIRKNGTATGCEVLSEKIIAQVNEAIARCPYRVGSFFFTNQNAANIRNKKHRLEKLKAERTFAAKIAEGGANADEMEKNGIRLVNNHEAARVQLFFPGKPTEEQRETLKSNGFRWSPRFGAWQRQNTLNGLAVARRIFENWEG